MTRIERKIWNAERGGFTGTGEVMDVDIDTLEPATERLRVTGDRFLKGPVPWSWIAGAAALPGQALLVGLCIWRLAGAKKEPYGVFRQLRSQAARH